MTLKSPITIHLITDPEWQISLKEYSERNNLDYVQLNQVVNKQKRHRAIEAQLKEDGLWRLLKYEESAKAN